MNRNRKGKTAGVVIAVAFLLFAAILVLFLFLRHSQQKEAVVLPDIQEAEPAEQDSQTEPAEEYYTVSTENVLTMLQGLQNTDNCMQQFAVTRTSEDGQSDTALVAVWTSGTLIRLQITRGDSVVNLLSDGSLLYRWQDDGTSGTAELELNGLTPESIAGLPDRDLASGIRREQVQECQLEQLELASGTVDCIRVLLAENAGGQSEELWFNAENGLICRDSIRLSGGISCLIEEEEERTYAAGDEELNAMFTLPDGSLPFPLTEEAEQ